MTDKLNIDEYKAKLLTEKTRLEADLAEIGRRNPDNKEDWEATEGDIGEAPMSDPNEMADAMEAFESRSATLHELEESLKDVVLALEKIEKGTYGICEISGKQIEKIA
jgi:RNA polymerase-binding transcription factor DksA